MLADPPPRRSSPTPHERTCRSRLNYHVGTYPNELTNKRQIIPSYLLYRIRPRTKVAGIQTSPKHRWTRPKAYSAMARAVHNMFQIVVGCVSKLTPGRPETSVCTFDPNRITQTSSICSGAGLLQTREVIPRKDFADSCFGRIRNGPATYRHLSSC